MFWRSMAHLAVLQGLLWPFVIFPLRPCCAEEPYFAQDNVVAVEPFEVGDHSSICGLLALAAAANAIGMENSLARCLDAEYISSEAGSSITDLKRAAESLGLHAHPFYRLSLEELRCARSPILLHVHRLGWASNEEHWITFLGLDEGEFRVFDSRVGIQRYRPAQLLSQWDGIGLLVSQQPVSLFHFLAPGRAIRFGCWLICGTVVLVASTSNVISRFSVAMIPVGPVLAVLSTALVIGQFWDQLTDHGFRQNRAAVATLVRQTSRVPVLPEVTFRDLEQLRAKGKERLLLIDARLGRDFADGAIPGAISIPIDALPFTIGDQLAETKRNVPVILYCHGETCDFSDRVAAEVVALGFIDVRIYRGGWRDWVQHYANALSAGETQPTDHDVLQSENEKLIESTTAR